MDEREALDAARQAVETATRHGADAAEATVGVTRRFHVEAREKTISKLEQSTGKTLQVRIFSGGRKVVAVDVGFFSFEASMRRSLQHSNNRSSLQSDQFSGLPDECGRFDGRSLALRFAALRNVTTPRRSTTRSLWKR